MTAQALEERIAYGVRVERNVLIAAAVRDVRLVIKDGRIVRGSPAALPRELQPA